LEACRVLNLSLESQLRGFRCKICPELNHHYHSAISGISLLPKLPYMAYHVFWACHKQHGAYLMFYVPVSPITPSRPSSLPGLPLVNQTEWCLSLVRYLFPQYIKTDARPFRALERLPLGSSTPNTKVRSKSIVFDLAHAFLNRFTTLGALSRAIYCPMTCTKRRNHSFTVGLTTQDSLFACSKISQSGLTPLCYLCSDTISQLLYTLLTISPYTSSPNYHRFSMHAPPP
jgi:hypothetical protein